MSAADQGVPRRDPDDMQTMLPALRAIIDGSTARVQRKAERRFSRMVKSQSSAEISQMRALRAPPTLFTRTSAGPHSSAMRAKAVCTTVSSVTSPVWEKAWTSWPRSSAATRSSPAASMSSNASRAPSLPRRRAMAAPRPFAAPVTMASRSCSRPMMRSL